VKSFGLQTAQEIGTAALDGWFDEARFGKHFAPIKSWVSWMVVMRVLFNLDLSADELALFELCTGRSDPFAHPVTEAWFLCGRRSGKSRFLALLAVVLACFRDYSAYRAPGERIVIMVLAVDRDQAGVIFKYAQALLVETPMLKRLLEGETAESLDLKNGVSIEVHVSSYRSVRGRTLAAALCDEICFWKSDESRNPGTAVLQALRPSLATIPDAPLICASSTYDRSGPAYDAFEKHWRKNESPVLVWKADTRTMNPSFRQSVIDEAFAQDAISAAAEYGSEFRSDVAAAFPDDVIDSAVCRGRRSLPPDAITNYVAFVDSSGGQHDAMACAIGHRERNRLVLDRLVVAKAPFEPNQVTADFAQVLSAYRVTTVTGDRYGSQWVVSAFAKHAINYRASDLDKSAIYRELTPLLSSGLVELLEDPRLLLELRQLERRPGKNGRGDMIDHRPGGRDDVCNAAAGCLVGASRYWGESLASNNDFALSRKLHRGGLDYDPHQKFAEEQRRTQ
jgi:hypothetical protein